LQQKNISAPTEIFFNNNSVMPINKILNMTKLSNLAEPAKRKRIINAKECQYDLRESLEKLFTAFWNAVRNYEKEIIQTPFEARCRGFEASLLNSKLIQSIQFVFKDDWKFGKYKRFMLRINGYILFFKKLNGKDMPMNIPTRFSSFIQNQEQGHLFDIYDNGTEPILFFGYNKSRFGEIINPKLVYIDENKVRWAIDENNISTSSINIDVQPPVTSLSVRQDIKITKKIKD
jgi:hypothetical protein